ncbi:hypothetical protein MTR67_043995, partial [Solanum verrucosum]
MSTANMVVHALSQLSMSSVSHIENGKKELVCDIHRLDRLGVFLVDSEDSGIIIQNGSESSIVSDVKAKKDLDPTTVELKKAIYENVVEV